MHFRSDFQNAKTGLSSNILGGIPALASNILALARKVVHDSLGWLLDAKDTVVGRRRVEADDGPARGDRILAKYATFVTQHIVAQQLV